MTKKMFLLFLALFSSFCFWLYMRGCDKRVDVNTSSTTLGPNVAEKLIVNPANHTLTIVKSSGDSQTIFLPDRPSSIEVGKDNKVQVSVRAYGTEVSPFIGFAYGDQARLALGVSGLYWNKWEVGLSVYPSVSGKFSLRFGPICSYSLYDNTSLFIGVTNTLSPIGGISLTF